MILVTRTLNQVLFVVACCWFAASLFAAEQKLPTGKAKGDKPRPIPTAEQIARFRQSYIHPKTGVKLTLKLDARQPPYKTVHKPGKGLNLRKSWQEKYESGVIPFRLNASFLYEETNKENPAGERKKYGAYFTPPVQANIVIKDGEGKVIANFDESQRVLCYH